MTFGEQLTQEIKCPHGKKTTPTWLDMHILQIRSSLQTKGVQHWIHFIIIMSNIWINFIKNMFKNEMDPVFWVLFFSEALGPIPNWILFRFPVFTRRYFWPCYDQEALKSLCQQVLDNHNELKSKLKASTDIENDCQFVLPKLLGQVMKLSNGKANSTQAKEAISELLGNHLINMLLKIRANLCFL